MIHYLQTACEQIWRSPYLPKQDEMKQTAKKILENPLLENGMKQTAKYFLEAPYLPKQDHVEQAAESFVKTPPLEDENSIF